MNKTLKIVTETKLFAAWWWSVMHSLVFKTSVSPHQRGTYAALDMVEQKLFVINIEGITEHVIEDDLTSTELPQITQIIQDANVAQLAVRVPGIIEVSAPFPIQARGNLRDVIGYEIDRLTPLQAGNAHFTYQVNEPGSDDVLIMVDLMAVDVDRLMTAQNLAKALNCHLMYLGSDPISQNGTNLMQPQRRSDAHTANTRFYLVATLSLLSLVVTPLLQKQKRLAVLQETVTPIENRARQKMSILNSLEDKLLWVETIRQGSPRFLGTLQDLTRQLGEQDVISYLVWNKSELEIAGTAIDSNQLIKKFATTKNVQSIEYLNPIQSDTDQFLEGFHLKLRFVTGSSLAPVDG